VWAGDSKVVILRYGTVDVLVQGYKREQVLRLKDVAFCENFACNLVSLRLLRSQGLWWDQRPGYDELRRADNSLVCKL